MKTWHYIKKSLVLGVTTEKVKKLGLFGYPSIISIATIITGCYFLLDRNLVEKNYLGLMYFCATLFVLVLLICIVWFCATLLRKSKLPKLPLRVPNESSQTEDDTECRPLVTDIWIIKTKISKLFASLDRCPGAESGFSCSGWRFLRFKIAF